ILHRFPHAHVDHHFFQAGNLHRGTVIEPLHQRRNNLFAEFLLQSGCRQHFSLPSLPGVTCRSLRPILWHSSLFSSCRPCPPRTCSPSVSVPWSSDLPASNWRCEWAPPPQ